MFDKLPETQPHKNKRKLRAFTGALALQAVLIAGLIVLQMAMPEKLGEFQLITTLHMAPPPPPPPPAPLSDAPEPVRRAQPKAAAVKRPAPVVTEMARVREPDPEPEVIAPTAIPSDIARIVESAPAGGGGTAGRGVPGGVPGGIPGGVPGGISSGVLGGVLGGVAEAPSLPPPKEPVRVGGNVKPPKLVRVEQPDYPTMAKRAKIEGVVVVEAVVTEKGTVDKVQIISGHPLLVDAAAAAVSRWKYEPTILNGQAVPVVLTARINFSLAESEK